MYRLLGERVSLVSLYEFIDTQKAQFPIRSLCRAVCVPESSYFDWNSTGRDRHRARVDAKAAFVAEIAAVHEESDASYGSVRVWAKLRDLGRTVSLRRVAETMATAGIAGVSGREHSTTTTRRDRLAAPFPDLVGRNFKPLFPNTVWYGDITYIWVKDRFWYVATVIDACTKEVLGWSFADHMRTDLVSDALHAAVRRRGGRIPDGVIYHSDRGSQYTSAEYGIVCDMYKIRQSMGRRGVCFDNAAAESFFSTIKRELIKRYSWPDAKTLRFHLFDWIESWYNRRRIHTSIGMRTPAKAYSDYLESRKAA